MKRFFTFNDFVTPQLMKVFFWVMIFFLVAICIASFVVSARTDSLDGMFSSVMVLVLGAILIRMACDVILVLFRIYGVLRDVRDAVQMSGPSGKYVGTSPK